MAIQSFIVKFWLQASDAESPATWHAQITHVPSGKQYYSKNLSEVLDFMLLHLDPVSKQLGLYFRVRRWMLRKRLPKT